MEKDIPNIDNYLSYLSQYRNFDFKIISFNNFNNQSFKKLGNIDIINETQMGFTEKVKNKLGFNLRINEINMYIPFFGILFNEYITTHTHWGATEITNLLGDLNAFHDDIIESDIYAVYENKTQNISSLFIKIDTTDKIIQKNVSKNCVYSTKINELAEFLKVKRNVSLTNTDFYNSNIFYNKNKFYILEDNDFIEVFSFNPSFNTDIYNTFPFFNVCYFTFGKQMDLEIGLSKSYIKSKYKDAQPSCINIIQKNLFTPRHVSNDVILNSSHFNFGLKTSHPFIFNNKGVKYIFMTIGESTENKYIAVSEIIMIKNNIFLTKPAKIFDCSHENDYAYIFLYKNKQYMIRNNVNNLFDLYESNNFPMEWNYVKTFENIIGKNVNVLFVKGVVYITCYNNNSHNIYYSDNLLGEFTKHDITILYNHDNFGYSLGKPVLINGVLYRVASTNENNNTLVTFKKISSVYKNNYIESDVYIFKGINFIDISDDIIVTETDISFI